ncbi:AMP-binding protein [Edaphocola aurantiacus]|uniref:AMP-binding protein n=1 Tax=Edaphocola aurantiacus TaxID=2601682 RepID=UPI001C96D9F6|nr:AMP-binding protein [Edaphocola aurantiacus]
MQLRQKIKKAYTLLRSVSRHGHNLISLLDSVRHTRAEDAFIDDDEQKISYQVLYTQALQTAYILYHQYHIKGGQRVLLACPNGIPFLTMLFALSALGCDIVLAGAELTETTLKSRLAGQTYDAVLLTGTYASSLPFRAIDLAEVINNIPVTTPRYAAAGQTSHLTVLSSGSQGLPRPYTRATMAWRYYRPFRDIYTQLQLQQYRSTYIAIPFSHGYGLAAVLLSIFLEKRIYCHPAYGSGHLHAASERESIDCWIVVPSMIPALYRHKEQLLRGTQAIISGGDQLESTWAKQILHDTDVQLYNLYGTSQTGICAIATTEMLRHNPGTLGKPIKGLRYTFVHCPEQEGKELWVKCTWSAGQPGQEFIGTGDIISVDEAGYWLYKGRKDQMQVIGGLNVYPEAIAQQIRKFSAVKTVHVFIQKDAVLRSHIHASITVHPGFDHDLFKQYLADVLPEYNIQTHITD